MAYKYIDPEDKDFNSEDPLIKVPGYGLKKRSFIRNVVKGILSSVSSDYKNLGDTDADLDVVASVVDALSSGGKLMSFIQADLGASNELEALRQKGGRRRVDIPTQG